jgi:hypothetical protein
MYAAAGDQSVALSVSVLAGKRHVTMQSRNDWATVPAWSTLPMFSVFKVEPKARMFQASADPAGFNASAQN